MKFLLRRAYRSQLCSLGQLIGSVSIPLFVFCMVLAILPGVLLSALLVWKALFFPTVMPRLLWGIFLPLWLLLSCMIPAFCAASSLAVHSPACSSRMCIWIPISVMHLLLAFLWALFLLYGLPSLFCMLSAGICAISALVCVRAAAKQHLCIGTAMLIFGIWNVFLVFLCADF